MPDNSPPFDLTPEEREDMQLIQAELDLHPDRLKTLIAELVLLRQLRLWASGHRDRFPPLLRAKMHALAHRAELRRAAAEDRAELEP
ncbi:MAG TPA: hypothetical protein VK583_07445 [Burkholderiales bacterium]|nr:hypothetical protein [Burkholderiales bacterium]